MSFNFTFVTCIYDIGFKGFDFYKTSFYNFVDLNPSFYYYIYTDQPDRFEKRDNVKIVYQKIKELPHYNFVQIGKEFLTEENKVNRTGLNGYLEINYSKISWLKESVGIYKYWIDAGLFCNDLFLKKYLNKSIDIEKLVKNSNHLICFQKQNKHRYLHGLDSRKLIEKALFKEDYLHTVGGFFGGREDNVENFINSFEQNMKEFVANMQFSTSECVLTSVCSNKYFKFNSFYFDQWYHEETRLYPSDTNSPMEVNKSSFCDVFAENFLKL